MQLYEFYVLLDYLSAMYGWVCQHVSVLAA